MTVSAGVIDAAGDIENAEAEGAGGLPKENGRAAGAPTTGLSLEADDKVLVEAEASLVLPSVAPDVLADADAFWP